MDSFGTSDIVLAATLRALGHRLVNIEKNNNKGTFFFENISPEIITNYDFGKILVEPVAFNNAIKALTTSARR